MAKSKITAQQVQERARALLTAMHTAPRPWKSIERDTGICRATLSAVARGKRKADAALLRVLGLPIIIDVRATTCPEHGVVHVGRCPGKRKPPLAWRVGRDLFDMSPRELAWRLIHREVV